MLWKLMNYILVGWITDFWFQFSNWQFDKMWCSTMVGTFGIWRFLHLKQNDKVVQNKTYLINIHHWTTIPVCIHTKLSGADTLICVHIINNNDNVIRNQIWSFVVFRERKSWILNFYLCVNAISFFSRRIDKTELPRMLWFDKNNYC